MSDTQLSPEERPYAELRDKIIGRLRTVYDPEISINIYDLGLIYRIELTPVENVSTLHLDIDMTLTAAGCPMADSIMAMTRHVLIDLPEIDDVQINLVWDPPWDKSRLSDEAKLMMDFF